VGKVSFPIMFIFGESTLDVLDHE